MFEPVAISVNRARAEIVHRQGDQQVASAPGIPAGERARRVFRAAAEEADALNHQGIGLAHILLGVLRERASAAATLLHSNGMHLQSGRDGIAKFLDEA
jgi:ATP-dependent Clp protease ATP-binding subunit ClpA